MILNRQVNLKDGKQSLILSMNVVMKSSHMIRTPAVLVIVPVTSFLRHRYDTMPPGQMVSCAMPSVNLKIGKNPLRLWKIVVLVNSDMIMRDVASQMVWVDVYSFHIMFCRIIFIILGNEFEPCTASSALLTIYTPVITAV